MVGWVDRIPKDNTTGLLAIVGNAAKGQEKYLVEHCIIAYRLRIAALMKQLCFPKKCLYVSTTLAETKAKVERVQGNFDWSRFIMGNLQRLLMTIHTWK